jgi:hypothetical protein
MKMISIPFLKNNCQRPDSRKKWKGEKMLFVSVDLPAKRSGACPYAHVLECFQSVFNMQEDKATLRTHYVDEFKRHVSVEAN